MSQPTDKGEWVSVEDRLPENNDNVLIYANKTGEKIEIAFYNDDDKEWQGLNSFWLPYVTHWQPLPSPPLKP